ncbi:MAG: IS3 family transposase, partial [Thermoanaerobaculia bacterium]
MKFRLVRELADDGIAVSVTCRVLAVSRAGFYEWRDRPPSKREIANIELTNTIREIHAMSRRSYGSPMVHKELTMGRSVRCSRKRIERLMRHDGLHGSYRRKGHRTKPLPPTQDDLVARQFSVDRPNKLWVTDVTEHPTSEGKVYAAVVLDAFSRRVIGLSIADHLRSEIVVDALEMVRWRRGEVTGTIVHSDHRSQYTSWVFGQRLRSAGLLGSMGRIGSALDNALAESFFSRLQLDL